MGIEDNDLLETALDRAEDTIAERVEAETSAEPEKDPVEEVAIQEKLAESQQTKPERTKPIKGPKGRPSREATSDQAVTTDREVPAESASEPIPDLSFWSSEEKALLAKADPSLRSIVAAKEAQRNDWVNRVTADAQRGKAIEKRTNEIFPPEIARDLRIRYGLKDPFDAVERLMDWNSLIEEDPVAAIVDLMRKNNITPEYLLNGDNEQFQESPEDKRYQELQSELQQMKEERENESRARFFQMVESFKDGKDSYGNVRRTFAAAYAPQIDQAAREIQEAYPNMQMPEVLHHAYEFTLEEHRKLHGITGRQSQQTSTANAQKAMAAASSVSGNPARPVTGRSRLKGNSFSEKLDSALDAAEEVVSSR